jgi:hypothetical protein
VNAKATTQAAPADLTTLDDEGLHAILEEQDALIRAAGDVKQTVKAERDRRAVAEIAAGLSDTQREQLAAQLVEGMTDEQRQSLDQVVSIGPIDSGEAVGIPG